MLGQGPLAFEEILSDPVNLHHFKRFCVQASPNPNPKSYPLTLALALALDFALALALAAEWARTGLRFIPPPIARAHG